MSAYYKCVGYFKDISINSDSVSNVCEIGVLIGKEAISYKDNIDSLIFKLSDK